jgi:hypothetical protein
MCELNSAEANYKFARIFEKEQQTYKTYPNTVSIIMMMMMMMIIIP